MASIRVNRCFEPLEVTASGNSEVFLSLNKVTFLTVEEYLSDTKSDEKFNYKLSSRSLRVFEELDIPKLDLFLNQILR